MKELYSRYISEYKILQKIAQKYELSEISEKVDRYISEMQDFRVTAPLVGGFSTGKSSLINAMLETEFLEIGATPETAVPTEIIYGPQISERTENDVKYIQLDSSFLAQIRNVKIVDMPGFDSGIDLHNRAIDEYLPKSLAYIITVGADEGTLRGSIINFLGELNLNSMPVYFVITKADKLYPDEIDVLKSHIKKTVKNSFKIDDAEIIVTSSESDDGIDGLKNIFLDIQAKSDTIFKKRYSLYLTGMVRDIRNYLDIMLSKNDYTIEQLQADIEELQKNIENLNNEYIREREKFERQLDDCSRNIKSKVRSELSKSSGTLESMLIQGSDVSEKINLIVRNTITSEINRQLDGKVKQYIENVSEIINANMTVNQSGDVLSADVVAENEQMKNSLNGLVTPVSTIVSTLITTALTSAVSGTAVGASLGSLLGPVGIAVGVLAGTFIGGLINSGMRDREEEQRRNAAREKVSQIIRSVSEDAASHIDAYISKIRDGVNDRLEKTIAEKVSIQEKALADTKKQIILNQEERKQKISGITADKNVLSDLMKGLEYGNK